MSHENVDRVREAYAAFNRGDLAAAGEILHPDLEWHPYLGALEGSIYRGRDAIMKMWSDLEDGFGSSLRIEVLELIDCGEKIVAVIEARATGMGSGADVRQRWVQVATMRDGLVYRVEPFADRDAALDAAGLTE